MRVAAAIAGGLSVIAVSGCGGSQAKRVPERSLAAVVSEICRAAVPVNEPVKDGRITSLGIENALEKPFRGTSSGGAWKALRVSLQAEVSMFQGLERWSADSSVLRQAESRLARMQA